MKTSYSKMHEPRLRELKENGFVIYRLSSNRFAREGDEKISICKPTEWEETLLLPFELKTFQFGGMFTCDESTSCGRGVRDKNCDRAVNC